MRLLDDLHDKHFLSVINSQNQPHLKPYRQGRIDALCGVYCIINTVHYLCGPLNVSQAQKLFAKSMRYLERSNSALSRLQTGTTFEELSDAIENVIIKNYSINWSRPFYRKRGVSLDFFWTHIQSFIENDGGIVVLCLGGEHDHWTLVRKVTRHSLILFDSAGLSRLPRKNSTTSEDHPTRAHILYRTHVLYLWKNNDSVSKEMI